MAKYNLTAKQVAKLFGVSTVTAWRWGDTGKLACKRTNGGIRFNEVEVTKWLDELRAYTLKTADVMKLAGVSRQTVGNWVLSGELSSRKNPGGGEVQFKPSEVERFLSLRVNGRVNNEKEEGIIMAEKNNKFEPLLTPTEVAEMFRVDPQTVTRWAKAGKLTAIRTLGGHRRYKEAEVRALLGSG